MERLDGSSAVPAALRGGIVALGNFDGFHLGHQAVVGRAIARARAEGRPALVATFDPHPKRFFRPGSSSFRLTTLEQREELVRAAGADAMLVFTFDQALSSLSSAEFVTDRLIGQMHIGGVVTGEDFTFGKGRSGGVAELAALGRHHSFSVDTVAPVAFDNEIVSSSRIRALLQSGDPVGAARLLTRPYTIRGVVEHGDKLGRTLGFPTANLALANYLRPAYGIYAVRGRLANGRVVDGAASLGVRPTFDPPKELLEPYFLDFSGDLYGQILDVELVAFLREEIKFDQLDALRLQIEADCADARRALNAATP